MALESAPRRERSSAGASGLRAGRRAPRQWRNRCAALFRDFGSPDLLIVDELGYLSFDNRGADLLYQVFNRRYQRASTIVTTNLAFKDWGKLFHNAGAASAVAERVVHRGLLIKIVGKSHRYDMAG